jgi:hypothetical protein
MVLLPVGRLGERASPVVQHDHRNIKFSLDGGTHAV